MHNGILERKTEKERNYSVYLSHCSESISTSSQYFWNPTEDMKVVEDSFARGTFQLRAATVIEFLIEKGQWFEISSTAFSLTGSHSNPHPDWRNDADQIKLCTVFTLVSSHLHCLIPQAWLLFTKRAKVWDVHWDACKCLTADALEFWCKDAAGITGADHLTVKKETDSSWKANEHVSAIWGSRPKRYPFSATRQRALEPHQSHFYPNTLFKVDEAQSCNPLGWRCTWGLSQHTSFPFDYSVPWTGDYTSNELMIDGHWDFGLNYRLHCPINQ